MKVPDPTKESSYGLILISGRVELDLLQDGIKRVLQSWPLPRVYRADEWVPLELRFVGDKLDVSVEGTPLGTFRDATLTEAGQIGVHAQANGYFRDVVYVPLDGTNAASVGTATERWQDMLRDSTKLDLTGGAERTPAGLQFVGDGSAMLSSPPRDGAIRVRATFGGLRVQLIARADGAGGRYQLYAFNEKTIGLDRWDNVSHKNTILSSFPLPTPLKSGQDYTLELRVVGPLLTAKLNNEILGTVRDEALPQGRVRHPGARARPC